jgi:hypothetical protein
MINPREVLDLYKDHEIGILNLDNIDLVEIAHQYQQEGLVTIANIIKPVVLDNFYAFVIDEMPPWWWFYHFRAGKEETHNGKIKNDPVAQHQNIIDHRKWAKETKDLNRFAYFYKRTFEDHYPLCKCGLCKFLVPFYKELRYLLAVITGKDLEKRETFLQMAEEGDFNGFHHDEDKGELAMVLHLTKGWTHGAGGEFFMFDDTGTIIEKALPPSYNNLVLMRLDHGVNKNLRYHMVTPVASPTLKRCVVSGWWKEKEV